MSFGLHSLYALIQYIQNSYLDMRSSLWQCVASAAITVRHSALLQAARIVGLRLLAHEYCLFTRIWP